MKNVIVLISASLHRTARSTSILLIVALLLPGLLVLPVLPQGASVVEPFIPNAVKVLVVSPSLLYTSGAGLLVSDLARYGFNVTYQASAPSTNPDYLTDSKTAFLDQYDVVILHGILGYAPSKVSYAELAHFVDYDGMLVVIGNALFTNETSGQFWENTFVSAPILQLEQRLGVDFTGYLTAPPYHNNGTFGLVDRSVSGLPETLTYNTVYDATINRQFAITPTGATEIYNFTAQNGFTSAGVTYYENATSGAVGVYIQGSYIHGDESPIGSRRIRYFGLADTETRARLLTSLIAFSVGADIETIIKPQPLASIRLDGLGERAYSDSYLNTSLAYFNAVVDKYGIAPSVGFTDFNDLYPQYWQRDAPVALSQLRTRYGDWEYGSSLRNKDLTLMTQNEIVALLQSIKSNYTELKMNSFGTAATSAGLWNVATLQTMADEAVWLLDSAGVHATLLSDHSDWWNPSVSSGVIVHNGVRMTDKSVENFTQFGYTQDYLNYLYFSMRDRLALSVVNGFPSFVYSVANFRWDQVGTYSVQTVYENLTFDIPDVRFVSLVEASLYFGDKWVRIENPVRDGAVIDFDLNAAEIPEVASIGKGMVWLRINSVETIGEVTINGQPWFYFDDHSIRLPADSVHVKVVLGQHVTPLVIESTQKVTATSWDTENFVATVSAAAGLNVTIKVLIPQIGPFTGYWTAYCSEAQGNWSYAFDDLTRVLSFWAISDGSITFSAGADVVPPFIAKPDAISSTTIYSENARVIVDITDSGSGVRTAILSYSVQMAEWVNVTMSLVYRSFFAADIPAFPYGTVVSYKILAEDNAENWGVSGVYSYTVDDRTHPSIRTVEWAPEAPYVDQSVLVRVNVTEPEGASGFGYVKLFYSVDGRTFASINMSSDSENETWVGSIPPRNSSGQVTFYVQAFDKAGNWMRTRNFTYVAQGGITSIFLPVVVGVAIVAVVAVSIFYVVKVRKRAKASVKARKGA
jgi:hypothetical protein